MAIADVTVFGAGIIGLSVAWACARRGARVLVIDPDGPGAGASGGVVGALSPHVPEGWDELKAFQFEALCMAPDWWAGVGAAGGGNPGFARTGRLQPLADAAAVERARARSIGARTLWQGAYRWEVVEVAGQPFAPVSATGLAVLDTLSARLSPAGALAALTAALTARGGRIVAEGRPQGRLIHATGHRGLTADGLGGGVKGQAAVLGHDAGPVAQVHADGVLIVPHADGTVAVGSTSERAWQHEKATDALLDAVIDRARHIVPALAGAPVLRRWAGIRPRAVTGRPLLGPHPARPGEYVANGAFRIGFGLAPLIGETMAALVLEGENRIPPSFGP
ncbi:MAG: FAD-binding oxidoreductase [Rubellimicrobium sp.]|nr:FAD-binding oxidoreductase [Rubellimicrobium sp.]